MLARIASWSRSRTASAVRDIITVNVTVSRPVLTLKSNAAMDGYVLETAESSTLGGAMNSAATTFNVGDDAPTGSIGRSCPSTPRPLPDNAVITAVTLKIRRQGSVGAANPFLTLGNIAVDIKKGNFGAPALQAPDFQTAASKSNALVFTNTLANTWYSKALAAGQLRLHQQGWEHPVPPALHEGR